MFGWVAGWLQWVGRKQEGRGGEKEREEWLGGWVSQSPPNTARNDPSPLCVTLRLGKPRFGGSGYTCGEPSCWPGTSPQSKCTTSLINSGPFHRYGGHGSGATEPKGARAAGCGAPSKFLLGPTHCASGRHRAHLLCGHPGVAMETGPLCTQLGASLPPPSPPRPGLSPGGGEEARVCQLSTGPPG